MKNNKLKYAAVSLLALTPAISFAALDGLKGLLNDFAFIIGQVWYIVIALAFVFFFWGAGQFILQAGDPKVRAEGRQKMIWGVVALFVIVSIYGIFAFIQSLLGVPTGSSTIAPPPTIGS